ncbi:MAG: heavy metal response regulator transcription factor [Salinisphaera sp.]|jgi:two-component system copper resistance phosphate regulon response regulator CusR|nr:heavy metal response regulator transcription factor [Salinisphaera sp.]
MHLLIVEDETKTAAYLRRGLQENGFRVDVAANGIDGLHRALEGAHDLIVLDVMLPHLDGWHVLQELRAAERTTPVLLLTARDGVDDRVKGLEGGADDYLVKPFAFSELLARIRVVLRRAQPQSEPVVTVADLVLDVLTRRAMRQEARIDLTAREFALLWLLMRHAGEVLSRTLISEKVWDMNFDGDSNVVEVAIRRLRRKVDAPFDAPLIHTVRGMGYVLEAR